MRNRLDLGERLRAAQRDSKNPTRFEKELTLAFQELFGSNNARHIGGADAPDILIEVEGGRVIINAKTTDRKLVTEAQIRSDVDEKHRKEFNAELVAYVGVGFSEGNIREFAKARGAVLVETEAICKLLENHRIKPYEPQSLFQTLFEGRETVVVSPNDIESSTKPLGRKLEVVKEIIDGLKRLGKIEVEDVYRHMRFIGKEFRKEEFQEAFKFLSTPV